LIVAHNLLGKPLRYLKYHPIKGLNDYSGFRLKLEARMEWKDLYEVLTLLSSILISWNELNHFRIWSKEIKQACKLTQLAIVVTASHGNNSSLYSGGYK
jgi:hypothetical protein